jgi:hypothetical protein
MRWFGESWGAPVCQEAEHVDTPVDHACLYCGQMIDEDDSGFEMPYLSEEGPTITFVHRNCLLRAILPSGLAPPV